MRSPSLGTRLPCNNLFLYDVLQVNLGAQYRIVSVQTIGNQHPDHGPYYLQEYEIIYSSDGANWISARNSDGSTTFPGNTDTTNTVENEFNVDSIQAQYVRIVAISWIPTNSASLRWGLMGCQVDSSVTPECSASLVGPCVEGEIDLIEAQQDSAFTASTNANYFDAFRSKYSGYGWKMASSDSDPWLQVKTTVLC